MLIDNKKNGKVGDVLKQNIRNSSKLSIISGYFTIYAFDALKKELSKVSSLRLLFSNPTFKTNSNSLKLSGESEEIKLKNSLQQVKIARECASWIQQKVEAKQVKVSGAIPFNLYYIANNGSSSAIQGSSNFSSSGLGYINSNTFHMNTLVKDRETTSSLLATFDEIWNNTSMVSDIKKEILEKTVKESFSPEFKMMRLMHKRPIFNSANFFLLDTGNLRILNEKNSSNIEFSQISEKISNL